MEEFFYRNKHYIQIDSDNNILNGWSDGLRQDISTENAICINNQGGYQFRLYPNGEENPALFTMEGIPIYRWNGTMIVRKTESEIDAELAALSAQILQPSQNARISALETALLTVMEEQHV